MMAFARRPPCNTEERIRELRQHALNHQGARGRSDRGEAYSVVVQARDPDGAVAEYVGYISAVAAGYVRLSLLKRTGGGFIALSYARMISIERAPYVALGGEAKP